MLLQTAEVLTSLLISFISAPCCHSAQTSPDPIAAGVRAHRPSTTAHYSETLKGGLGGRWGGGRTDGNGGVALTRFPLFPLPPSCWPTSAVTTLRYIDRARSNWSQQDKNITQLPGPCSQSLHVAHIPVAPGKMTLTHDWLLYILTFYRHLVWHPNPYGA